MSLNTEELARTRSELGANLDLAGLTTAQVAADLDWSANRLQTALHSTKPSDPVDVWQLRDYLEHAVRDAGHTPVPFTILTSRNRILARMWFNLRKAPRHDFASA